jgi:2-polyprenyl-3-methyl-5-hydroxy-6-metoxy-1,4-benzoquinol methylase
MTETTHAQAFWEDFYRERPVWSGKPNALLVREVEALPPGTALDLGCAEGADAVWLAQRGWRVTGADASATALGRAVAHAAEAGVEVDWQCHDLSRTFPDGSFDLVSAQYLHTPPEVGVDGERSAILRRAAAAVAPGGVLLVIGHEKHERHPEADLPTTGEVLAGLDLDPVAWRVELEDVVERAMTDPDGRPGTRRDNVLRLRRVG